jgi:hypothetical protein
LTFLIDGKHSVIFKATADLKAQGISPGILSVTRRLNETGQTDSSGGPAYVANLTSYVPLKGVIPYYAQTIADEYEKRRVKTALVKALEEIDKSRDAGRVIQNIISELSVHKKDTGKKTEWTAAELKTHEFPDIQWVVPDLVATGLSVLAGAPKVKKSWLALSMAIAAASGGAVLGKIPVQKQGVLCLALEDSPRRLQDRMNKLGMGYPENLHFFTEWKTGAAGLKSYLRQHTEIRFCIIDTWAVFSPHRDQNDYSEATRRAHELKAVADEMSIAILIIHHAKKGGNYGEAGDWMDFILGSTGLAGAVDSIILLRRKRGEEKAELLATGRDILEKDFILSFDLDCGGWTIDGDKQTLLEGERQQDIFDWLQENGPHSPKEIFKGMKDGGYGDSPVTLRVILSKMTDKGILQKQGHEYFIPSAGPAANDYKEPEPPTEPEPPPDLFTREPAPETPPPELPDIPPGYGAHYDYAYSEFLTKGRTPEQADREAREQVNREYQSRAAEPEIW